MNNGIYEQVELGAVVRAKGRAATGGIVCTSTNQVWVSFECLRQCLPTTAKCPRLIDGGARIMRQSITMTLENSARGGVDGRTTAALAGVVIHWGVDVGHPTTVFVPVM